jgi:VIT1/CCC1 family predicted Fe2+/Mn2+ transporter
MKLFAGLYSREHIFSFVIGPIDGILTALTFAAGRIVMMAQPIDISLAARIALAASLSGGLVFFVAEYARLRGELVHAGEHLNLAAARELATSRLGNEILREAFHGAITATMGGFAGAMLPLALGALFSAISWMAIAVAVAVLGLLGIFVSRVVRGNPISTKPRYPTR